MDSKKFNIIAEFPTGISKRNGKTIYTLQTSVRERHRIESDLASMIMDKRETDKKNWKNKQGWKNYQSDYPPRDEAKDMLNAWMMLEITKLCQLEAAHKMTMTLKIKK